jgi:HAD superfamily phosphoserine phosphatase-like hydrolase
VTDVAAFDFDGTLTEGGSVFAILAEVAGRRTALAASARLAPALAYAAMVSGDAADRTKELLLERILAGVALSRIEEVAADFAHRHLARHGRPEVRARLDWHLGRGDAVVVVSASLDVYVHHAAAELGGGTLTGRYEGRNCRGEEKLRRLRGWIDGAAPGAQRLWAYGNSRGDLRMLSAADVGVDVGKLGPLGALRSFPRLTATGPGRTG